jgi:tetratricopeptide (TPR) repeat protein
MMSPESRSDAAETAPLAAESLYFQAVDSLALGDLPGAIAGFRASLASDPGYTDAAHGLMHALKEAGHLDEAISIAQRLIAAYPDDVLAHTSLSILYQASGRIAEAESAATHAKLLGWKLELRLQTEVGNRR